MVRIKEDNVMTVKEIAFKFEELQIESWALNSLAMAINDAITEGPNAESNFYGALYMLTKITNELEREMKILRDDLFEIIKVEQKGA